MTDLWFSFCICLSVLFGSGQSNSIDCKEVPWHTIEVLENEQLTFSLDRNHSLYNTFLVKFTNDTTIDIVIYNNDEENPPYVNPSYRKRLTVNRTESYFSIKIAGSRSSDGGNYFILETNDHDTMQKCFRVFVLAKPTSPMMTVNGGHSKMVSSGYARIECFSNQTTAPKNPDWPLIKSFEVNGTKIGPTTGGRFMTTGDELLIGHLTAADGSVYITCSVKEENGFPGSVSSTIIISASASGSSDASAQQGNSHGKTDCDNTGWIVAVVLLSIAAVALSGGVAFLCWRRKSGRY